MNSVKHDMKMILAVSVKMWALVEHLEQNYYANAK